MDSTNVDRRVAMANAVLSSDADHKLTVKIDVSDVDELVGSLRPTDHEAFLRLIWDVRGALFDLPHSIYYGKFLIMCTTLGDETNHASFDFLRRMHVIEFSELKQRVSFMPLEYTHCFTKLAVRKIDSTADDIIRAACRGALTSLVSSTRFIADLSVNGTTEKLKLMVECYKVKECSLYDKEYLLRLKLSECPYITARSALMLMDKVIPLRAIKPYDTEEKIITALFQYRNQCVPSAEVPDPELEWQ